MAESVRELSFASCQVDRVLHFRPQLAGQIALVCRAARSFPQNFGFSEARGETNFVSIVMHGAALHEWVIPTVMNMS